MRDVADKRLAKRYEALKRKQGTCIACIYRDKELHHGWAVCQGDFRRQHPTCASDAKEPKFRLDVEVVNGLKDRE